MNNYLYIIFTTYAFALLVNSIITFSLWNHNRDPLYKILLKIWLSYFLNYVLQAVFHTPSVKMLACFGTLSFCSVYLVELFLTSQKKSFKIFPYIIMSIFSVLLGALIFETTGNSQWALIPIAISVASPLLQTAFRTLIQYKSNDFYQRFFAILLFFNGLEYLAYPFLRRIEPLGLTLSISLAHIILFTMSVFLPAFILRNNYKDNIAELEKEVAKRTFSLTEKNRELLELSRENLSLINIVCHDLATSISILNANCFYINIRLTIAEKEKYGSHLEMIQRTLKIINEIFEKVKVLEAVKTGKIHLELTPVNLLEELRESVHLFNDLISEKKLQLRLDCNLPQDTLVLADPVILRNQIINNLISNSIKFSQENGEIEISAIAENNKVYLHIRDHGIGIPAKMLPNLFSFESPTTRQGTKGEKGTGFGLTLVKVCVEKFGGHISVKSETVEDGASDHGSTFIIELKRAN